MLEGKINRIENNTFKQIFASKTGILQYYTKLYGAVRLLMQNNFYNDVVGME